MPVEVNENFGLRVGLQLFRLWEVWGVSASKQVQNRLISQIFGFVVDLNIITVEVFGMVSLCPQLPPMWISAIANVVLWQHQKDLNFKICFNTKDMELTLSSVMPLSLRYL